MVVSRLRDATRAAHASIAGSVKLLPEPTREHYAWFLAKFLGFHAPLEAGWEAWTATCPDLRTDLAVRRRLPLLERDLRALGCDPCLLPRCPTLPEVCSAAQALGVLYVSEGATLGGQVLARRVQDALGLGPENGAAFLVGHGPRTRALWEALCAQLEAFGAAYPQDVGQLTRSAVQCFECLQHWLEDDP